MSESDDNAETGGGTLKCPRCSGGAYLSARIPHHMQLSGGRVAHGHRTIVLCPECDRDDPTASGVLAFFTMHERIEPDTVEEVTPLIDEWIRRRSKESYSNADLIEDIRSWEQGEM